MRFFHDEAILAWGGCRYFQHKFDDSVVMLVNFVMADQYRPLLLNLMSYRVVHISNTFVRRKKIQNVNNEVQF